MKLLYAIFCLLIFSTGFFAQDYNCEKLKGNETTRRGYEARVVVKEKNSFQIVKAIVRVNDDPAKDVFVEIFTENNPNRIDGCKTGVDGKFSFPNLKEGKYKIRLSKDGGFMITEITIKVSPKSKNRKDLVARIELA